MKIVKRSGAEVEFERQKIVNAITLANSEINPKDRISDSDIARIADAVVAECERQNRVVSVEDVQDIVQHELAVMGNFALSKHYIVYRYEHQQRRELAPVEKEIMSIVNDQNEATKGENGNKDPKINSTLHYYVASAVCKDIARKSMLPEEVVHAHDEGVIHFHDMDVQPVIPETNCGLVNLKDVYENGTVLGEVAIGTPKSLTVAATVASQVILAVANSQVGGITISLSHIARYVDVSRKKFRKRLVEYIADAGVTMTDEQIDKIVEDQVDQEIKDAVQTLSYQILSMNSAQGQAGFVTLFMYLNEAEDQQHKDDLNKMIMEVLRQREAGMPDGKGHVLTQTFPKLVYALEDDNITPDGKYYETTVEAAKCVSMRMNPDFVSEKVMMKEKGMMVPPMGCRSLLSPYYDKDGKPQTYGRLNLGVTTINLPEVAAASGGDFNKFWETLDKNLEICHTAMKCRIARFENVTSDVAPTLWQHGVYLRLKPGEKVLPHLKGGYATISLGYGGLANTVRYMTGEDQFTGRGKEFGMAIMNHLNAKCDQWKEEENIGYSIYGTPMENTTYKFARCLQRRYGIVPDISDRDYIINSYHYDVTQHVDAFTKLTNEAEYAAKSKGGAVSYVEIPNMKNNVEAILDIMKHMYDTILYAELNLRNQDTCLTCGFQGELKTKTVEGGKIIWYCPNCGEENQRQLSVIRRLCGYLPAASTCEVKQAKGRTEDIIDRVLHL